MVLRRHLVKAPTMRLPLGLVWRQQARGIGGGRISSSRRRKTRQVGRHLSRRCRVTSLTNNRRMFTRLCPTT